MRYRSHLLTGIALGILSFSTSVCAEIGVAHVRGTAGHESLEGTVHFQETPEGMAIEATFNNLPEGAHGFHIHEHGSCDDQGKAAGGHFNPDGVKHGDIVKDGFTNAHAGDLGNLTASAEKTASLSKVVPQLRLSSGPYAVAGRSVIVHEAQDDFGQPTGNAGGRIGCGVITVTDSATEGQP